jgi:hypothetical protein
MIIFRNKMGVYAWDELEADKDEFVLAICLQLGIGKILTSEKTPRGAAMTRTMDLQGGEGFGGLVRFPFFEFKILTYSFIYLETVANPRFYFY